MAAVKIVDDIILGSWGTSPVKLTTSNSFYLIGIKESKVAEDEIDPKTVKSVVLKAGIDAGLTEPLNIGTIVLNFTDETSDNATINEATALNRQIGYPEEFYLKPIQLITKDGEIIDKGHTRIDINILEMKFI